MYGITLGSFIIKDYNLVSGLRKRQPDGLERPCLPDGSTRAPPEGCSSMEKAISDYIDIQINVDVLDECKKQWEIGWIKQGDVYTLEKTPWWAETQKRNLEVL